MWLVCLLIGEVEFFVWGWKCFIVGFLLINVLDMIKFLMFKLKLFFVLVIVDIKIFLMILVDLFGVNFKIEIVFVMFFFLIRLIIKCVLWGEVWIVFVVVLVDVICFDICIFFF